MTPKELLYIMKGALEPEKPIRDMMYTLLRQQRKQSLEVQYKIYFTFCYYISHDQGLAALTKDDQFMSLLLEKNDYLRCKFVKDGDAWVQKNPIDFKAINGNQVERKSIDESHKKPKMNPALTLTKNELSQMIEERLLKLLNIDQFSKVAPKVASSKPEKSGPGLSLSVDTKMEADSPRGGSVVLTPSFKALLKEQGVCWHSESSLSPCRNGRKTPRGFS